MPRQPYGPAYDPRFVKAWNCMLAPLRTGLCKRGSRFTVGLSVHLRPPPAASHHYSRKHQATTFAQQRAEVEAARKEKASVVLLRACTCMALKSPS